MDGDLYLDYGVSGNKLSRPGLDALFRRAETDRSVTHVFIPRRDRFARPDDPIDGIVLERKFHALGLTLVFMDRVVPPVGPGQRRNITDPLLALLDYDAAGKFRWDLAQKLLLAQVRLAKAGFSIGGYPLYGFERWLVREADGQPVRKLADGEHTKMASHHVCWLPTDEAKLAVLRRIISLLEAGTPAGRVAGQLTAERVPVPDPRRNRTGVWHATTIRGLATHPLLRAVVESGKRCEGDQQRFTPAGPRPLTDADYRPDGKPKRLANPPAARIAVPAKFEPVINPARHEALVAELDRRGAHLRGKARARGTAPNPLGGRVWDLNCGWPMYRLARGPAYRYTCGLNQQSDSQACTYNWVDGPTAARFVLGCVRQRLLSPTTQAKLRAKLEQLAAAEASDDTAAKEAEAKRGALTEVTRKLDRVSANMALAETEAQYKAMAGQFEQLRAEHDRLEAELKTVSTAVVRSDPATEVDTALAAFDRLPELAAQPDDAAAVQTLVRQVDAKLYLRFRAESRGSRVVSKPAGGVLTFGSADPKVRVYEGQTDKAYVKTALASVGGAVPPELAPCCSCDPGPEAGLSGNRQRLTRRCT